MFDGHLIRHIEFFCLSVFIINLIKNDLLTQNQTYDVTVLVNILNISTGMKKLLKPRFLVCLPLFTPFNSQCNVCNLVIHIVNNLISCYYFILL